MIQCSETGKTIAINRFCFRPDYSIPSLEIRGFKHVSRVRDVCAPWSSALIAGVRQHRPDWIDDYTYPGITALKRYLIGLVVEQTFRLLRAWRQDVQECAASWLKGQENLITDAALDVYLTAWACKIIVAVELQAV